MRILFIIKNNKIIFTIPAHLATVRVKFKINVFLFKRAFKSNFKVFDISWKITVKNGPLSHH